MNKTYAISLTAMDEDDDAIQCRSSQYVEAGPRLTSHKFRNADVDLVSFRRSSIIESFVKNHFYMHQRYNRIYTVIVEMLLIICYSSANAIGFGIFTPFFTYALSRVVAKNSAFFFSKR